jgi:hypothetical protein
MSLSDLAALGSFVSGLAVLVSLVFLYFQLRQLAAQVRQAEKNQRALIQQARASRLSDHMDRIADPGVADAYRKGRWGDADLTITELYQFRVLFLSSLYGLEDSFFQHEQGLLEDAPFQSTVATFRAAFARPGTRVAWAMQRRFHEAGFQRFVDQMISEVQLETRPGDELAAWRASIAREIASVAET